MKKTKKLLAFFLTLSVLLSMVSFVPFSIGAAAPVATCTVAVKENNIGSSDYCVTADVTFASSSEFTAGVFKFEAQGLTFKDCTVKECVGGAAPEVEAAPEKSKIIFTGFSSSEVNDFRSYTKLTLSLKFTPSDGSNGVPSGKTYTVAVKDISIANVDEVKFLTADAQGQTSNTHIPGDINMDGRVNNKDLTRLFQYLSDWDVQVDSNALDVNGDGKVNNKDLTRLFQYLSDWDVQIF